MPLLFVGLLEVFKPSVPAAKGEAEECSVAVIL